MSGFTVVEGDVTIRNGTEAAAVKAASTAAVAADPALVVAVSPNNTVPVSVADTVGSAVALNALNVVASVVVVGQRSAGMQLAAGTLIGTIIPEVSLDNGTTWVQSFFDDPTTSQIAASIVFASSNTATTRSIICPGGASHVRVRVSAFTSGTASCVLRATQVDDQTSLLGAWLGSTAPTVGQKTMAASIPVTISSDQGLIPVTFATSTSVKDIAIGKILMGGAVSNTKNALRWTTYTEQTTGAQRSVKSSSANDTSAGTGARQLKITYFNSTLTTKSTETITLNGTTAVNTVATDICFIEKMEVVSVGSGGVNAGTLTLFTTTGGGGSAIGTIDVDVSGTRVGVSNRTYWGHHYVQSGVTCTINTFNCGTQGNQNAEAFLSSKDPTNANGPDKQISDSITAGLNSATASRPVPNTIFVTGPARITMYLIPAGNGTAFFGSFDYNEA